MMISIASVRAPLAAFLIAAALSAGAAVGHAQEGEGARLDSEIQKARSEIAQAKKDVQKAEAEVRKTDSLLREEAARTVQADERQAKDRERREKENASLQSRLQETQAKINAERSGQGRWQNAQDEIKARQKRLTGVLAGYCDSVVARIEAAPPWDRAPRLDRVRSLKKDLEAGSSSVEEGFARLNALVKEEIKSGDEIAVFNKPVTRKSGDMVNAQVLKIGNQWIVYVDDEGERFGILERTAAAGGTSTWEWREDPGFAEKNRIKAALEVKSAKRPPQLVVLDLGLALEAAPSKGGK
ncbi:MAG: DUF3450 domain-containing protein [Fibrobacterota bacterium]|nr:DUF3450 domain-containing protein [Fibrobacterota bacterium]